MWLAEQLRKNFLDFTRCHWLQLRPVFLDKKFLAFQSSKEFYLKLWLSLDVSFVVPLEFYQFDEEIILWGSNNCSMIPGTNYVASLWYWFLRFYLWLLWIVMPTNWSLVDKRNQGLLSPQIKILHSQYNTLRRFTYYKQSYCQDIQIYTIFGIHEG